MSPAVAAAKAAFACPIHSDSETQDKPYRVDGWFFDAKREYAYGPASGLPDTRFGTFSRSLMDEAG